MNSLTRSVLAGAGSLFVISAVMAGIYYLGHTNGAAKVTQVWTLENSRRDAASSLLVQKNKDLSAENKALTGRIGKELEDRDQKHKAALAALQSDFSVRLQQSEGRAGIYRKQAEGSTAEREHLASHAAELDRALEEGRSLVRELGETLRLRDDQIRQLSEQITADRALLN